MLLPALAATNFISGRQVPVESQNPCPQTTHSCSRIPKKNKLSEHIDVCGHGHFQVFQFYKLLSDDVIERREKKYFIQLFKPSLNSLS